MNSKDSTQQWGSLLPAPSVYRKCRGKNSFHLQRTGVLCCELGPTQAAGEWWVPGLFPFIQG